MCPTSSSRSRPPCLDPSINRQPTHSPNNLRPPHSHKPLPKKRPSKSTGSRQQHSTTEEVIIDKKDTSAIEEEKVSLVHDGEGTPSAEEGDQAEEVEEEVPKKGSEGE